MHVQENIIQRGMVQPDHRLKTATRKVCSAG